jgi:hypothetical protein
MLEGRAEHHARVLVERILGAVAVVHVEIQHRDPLQAVGGDRVRGADRDVVEDAEAHGLAARGVVPGRAHRAERAPRRARHHHVRGGDDRTRRAQRRRKRARVHRGIGIQVRIAARRRRLEDAIDVVRLVDALELLARGLRRLALPEPRAEPRRLEGGEDRLQALRRFGVSRAHLVQDAIGMREEDRAHAPILGVSRTAGA